MQYIEATEEAHPIHSMQRRVMHFAEISIFLAPFITFSPLVDGSSDNVPSTLSVSVHLECWNRILHNE